MGTLISHAEGKLRIVEELLASYSLDADNLREGMVALRELLATDKAFLYSLGQRGSSEDLTVTREILVGSSAPWGRVLDEFVQGRGVAWGGFNSIRPESEQRDVVLIDTEVDALTGGVSTLARAALYPRLGLATTDCCMRVVVCEGSSALGNVSLVQPAAFDAHQRALFQRLVPSFRKRLAFERMVSQSELADASMVVALDAIPAAAWLVGPTGAIQYANTAGRARLDADRAATYGALLAATRAPHEATQFKVAALRSGGGLAHIVVENAARAAATELGFATKRLGLTPAQGRVFEQVLAGASNGSIAAQLGIAERTVEAHVTAILVKAQVPSRAALIVQMFNGQRARAPRVVAQD